jgi:putative aminopeptidase FrvX
MLHRDATFDLLAELSAIVCPSGREEAIDAWLDARLAALGVRTDGAGNRIVRILGRGAAPATALTAHKDEIGAMVKRVEADGRVRLVPIGDAHPFIWGETPLDLLGDRGTATGVLSFGSRHVSHESPQRSQTDSPPEGVPWADAWVETKRTAGELVGLGIRAGTRAALPASRRRPVRLGAEDEFIACPALDDKAAIAVLLGLGERLKAPAGDVDLVFTSREEIGCMGATYYTRRADDVDRLVAIEVAPTAPEYDLACVADPVLIEADARSPLDHALGREIADAARAEGLAPHHVVLDRYGSDASTTYANGGVGRAACLAVATDNTHGCEIVHLDAIDGLVRTLTRWLA